MRSPATRRDDENDEHELVDVGVQAPHAQGRPVAVEAGTLRSGTFYVEPVRRIEVLVYAAARGWSLEEASAAVPKQSQHRSSEDAANDEPDDDDDDDDQ